MISIAVSVSSMYVDQHNINQDWFKNSTKKRFYRNNFQLYKQKSEPHKQLHKVVKNVSTSNKSTILYYTSKQTVDKYLAALPGFFYKNTIFLSPFFPDPWSGLTVSLRFIVASMMSVCDSTPKSFKILIFSSIL